MASSYPPEIKAQVIAKHGLGEPKARIARDLGVSRGYVQQVTRDAPPMLSSEKRDDLGRLVYEYVSATLLALTAQAKVAADPTYIWKQSADQLYLLHGTMADKAVSILERLEPVSFDGDDGPSPDPRISAPMAN